MKTRNKMYLRVLMLTFASMLFCLPAFASDPGVQLNTWLQTNVGGLIPGALLVVCLFCLIKRDWIKLISFFGMTLVVAAILNWNEIKKLSGSLWSAIFG